MPFADVGDLRVWHELRGRGPRLLFLGGLHGDLGRPATAFDRFLAERFTVLALDQRGMGRTSTTGGPDRPWTLADCAGDAAGLLDALGWPPCAVLGYSFGGMVAQELALRHPGRVGRLALLATSSGGAGEASYPFETLAHLTPEARARRLVELADTRRDAAWQAAHPEAHRALVEDALAAPPSAATRRRLEARARHDTWDRLPALAVPTLVAGGLHDGISPPANLRALAARIPGARLALFDGGHAFFLQDARAPGVIAGFLAGAT
ncbi:MAG: alpha/beta fold hydrolase [Deferrisomatales bacterium]